MNNKKILKKDYPLSATSGWIFNTKKNKEILPLKSVLREGAMFQELFDYVMSSPTSSLVLKDKMIKYKDLRESMHNDFFLINMMIIEDMKESEKYGKTT